MFVDDLNLLRCAKNEKSLTKYFHSKNKHTKNNVSDDMHYIFGVIGMIQRQEK